MSALAADAVIDRATPDVCRAAPGRSLSHAGGGSGGSAGHDTFAGEVGA